jgi:hypothetical protein
MTDIVEFVDALDVNTTRLGFTFYPGESAGGLEELPSLERFHNLEEVTISDFCDLTEVPRISAECVGIRYVLEMTNIQVYETFPTGDWNILVIDNAYIYALQWPRHLVHMVLTNCQIFEVSPPEGGTDDSSVLTMEACVFTNPFYQEMWNRIHAQCVEITGYEHDNHVNLNLLDHMVSLDNFALMRQCTLEDFARLADEEARVVNVTAWDVSKINSAAALASNVLRRAAEFVYF